MMITLFGKDISKLSYEDLKRERSVQKYLYNKLNSWLKAERYNNESYGLTEEQRLEERAKAQEEYDSGKITHRQWLARLGTIERRATNRRYDRIVLLENYLKNLEALVEEIDFYIERRAKSQTSASKRDSIKSIRERNAKARKQAINDNAKVYRWKQYADREIYNITWDKEKFMQIAKDRGYQTESALVYSVGQALNLDRARSKIIVDDGRFTWGQVLCLGAMFQMTPKEFCDTFLSGYFTESFGEYRADFDNINKTEALRSAIRPEG